MHVNYIADCIFYHWLYQIHVIRHLKICHSRLLKSGGGHRQGAKSGSDDSTPECVIVLADQYLLELPLEALRSLRAGNVDSVSRDISLQMFYHRFHVDVTGWLTQLQVG